MVRRWWSGGGGRFVAYSLMGESEDTEHPHREAGDKNLFFLCFGIIVMQGSYDLLEIRNYNFMSFSETVIRMNSLIITRRNKDSRCTVSFHMTSKLHVFSFDF